MRDLVWGELKKVDHTFLLPVLTVCITDSLLVEANEETIVPVFH